MKSQLTPPRPSLFAALWLVPLAFAGCTVGPNYETAESKADSAVYKEAGAGGGKSGQDSIPEAGDWWKRYHDATLTQLMKRLEADNPSAAAALARYDQARAALGLASADQVPTISGATSWKRIRSTENDFFVPPERDYSQYRGALNLRYEVDLWGRVRRNIEAARAESQAAAADYAGAVLSLKAELARTYFLYRFTEEEMDLVSRAIDLRAENSDLVKARFEGGEASELDFARANTELESARAQLHALERSKTEYFNALAALVGEAPGNFSLPGGAPGSLVRIPAGVPSELLARRPDVWAANERLHAAVARIGVTEANYLPKLTILGTGGLSSLSSGDFVEPASIFADIGPNLDLPLFQAGRSKSDKVRAVASAREAQGEFQNTVLQAIRETEDAMAGLRIIGREIDAHRKATDAANQAAKLSRERYDAGLVSYLEVVDAERTALQEQRSLTQAKSAHYVSSVLLIQSLGGGWQAE